jgi:bifunctional DNase/RNase
VSEPQTTTVVGAVTGTAGITFPIWGWFEGANQIIVAMLGIVVLSLTAYKLVLEILRLRRERRERGD